MKAKFKLISTMLIILLTVLLIVVLVSYYNSPVEVKEPNINNIAITNQEHNKVISEKEFDNTKNNIFTTSGEKNDINSGDNTSGETYSSIIPDSKDLDKAVIITSEDTMTNKEKRQILTELDNTLMELLDVVDKVQPVDETRLITDESEVQE